jgi:hypothetical protein
MGDTTVGSAPMRGLRLDVYRNAARTGDATLNGLTGRYTRVTLLGRVVYGVRQTPLVELLDPASRVSEPERDAPGVWLVVGKHGASDRHVIPADANGQPDMGRHYMSGGNFVSTTDSRWGKLLAGQGAVQVHDRHEG